MRTRCDGSHVAPDRRRAEAEDAQLLLAHGRSSGSYYLAGYAVEIGLKACISRKIAGETIPDEQFILSIYDHRLDKLAKVAGLDGPLMVRRETDSLFSANWGIVAEWRPDARYTTISGESADLLVSSIADPNHGVMEWIRAYW